MCSTLLFIIEWTPVEAKYLLMVFVSISKVDDDKASSQQLFFVVVFSQFSHTISLILFILFHIKKIRD